MLRLVPRTPLAPQATPRVIGLEEWAWRRGMRFGTIVGDRERHRVGELLPERSASSVAQWLHAHPRGEIVCRDRSSLYAEGLRQGAPQAVQVVDRLHLVQNLRNTLERFFRRYRHGLKTLGASVLPAPVESAPVPPPSCTTARQQRHERWVRLYYQMQRLHAQGLGIAAIVRRVHVSRPTVYRNLALPQPPERQRPYPRRPSLLTPFIPHLWRRGHVGCRKAQQRWRELVTQGYQQSQRTVQRYVGQRRRETGLQGAAGLCHGAPHRGRSRTCRPLAGGEQQADRGLSTSFDITETASLWPRRGRLLTAPYPGDADKGSCLTVSEDGVTIRVSAASVVWPRDAPGCAYHLQSCDRYHHPALCSSFFIERGADPTLFTSVWNETDCA